MEIDTYAVRRAGVKYRVMNYTKMANAYRGANCAHHIYALVAAKTGPIMSGTSQSPGARSLWNRLTKLCTVAVLWKGQLYDAYHTEWGEVEVDEFDCYDNSSRLIAA